MVFDSPRYINAVNDLAAEITAPGGKVLVTGASGLIGSCIIDALTQANALYGRDFTVYAMGRSREKLEARFGSSAGVRIVPQDVTQPIEIDGLDYIIHAASNADPRTYALYPAETIMTNVLGAKSVLEYCRNHSTRALLTSTFEVYGKLGKDEYTEEDFGTVNQNIIRSCYPESKRTAELLFRAYYGEYGTDCVIARLASIYGPTMQADDSKAHAQFLRNALTGEDIVLKSEGTQKRTYCCVFDAVSGIFAVLFKGKSGEAYNVANGKSVATIAEVARAVADLAGTKVVFDISDEFKGKGFAPPQNCVLVTEKLESLGWEGRYSLTEGLSATLEILKEMK